MRFSLLLLSLLAGFSAGVMMKKRQHQEMSRASSMSDTENYIHNYLSEADVTQIYELLTKDEMEFTENMKKFKFSNREQQNRKDIHKHYENMTKKKEELESLFQRIFESDSLNAKKLKNRLEPVVQRCNKLVKYFMEFNQSHIFYYMKFEEMKKVRESFGGAQESTKKEKKRLAKQQQKEIKKDEKLSSQKSSADSKTEIPMDTIPITDDIKHLTYTMVKSKKKKAAPLESTCKFYMDANSNTWVKCWTSESKDKTYEGVKYPKDKPYWQWNQVNHLTYTLDMTKYGEVLSKGVVIKAEAYAGRSKTLEWPMSAKSFAKFYNVVREKKSKIVQDIVTENVRLETDSFGPNGTFEVKYEKNELRLSIYDASKYDSQGFSNGTDDVYNGFLASIGEKSTETKMHYIDNTVSSLDVKLQDENSMLVSFRLKGPEKKHQIIVPRNLGGDIDDFLLVRAAFDDIKGLAGIKIPGDKSFPLTVEAKESQERKSATQNIVTEDMQIDSGPSNLFGNDHEQAYWSLMEIILKAYRDSQSIRAKLKKEKMQPKKHVIEEHQSATESKSATPKTDGEAALFPAKVLRDTSGGLIIHLNKIPTKSKEVEVYDEWAATRHPDVWGQETLLNFQDAKITPLECFKEAKEGLRTEVFTSQEVKIFAVEQKWTGEVEFMTKDLNDTMDPESYKDAGNFLVKIHELSGKWPGLSCHLTAPTEYDAVVEIPGGLPIELDSKKFAALL